MMKGVCPMRLDAISLRTDAKQSSSSPPKSKVMNLPTRLIHHIDGYPCSFSAWHHNNSGVNCRTFPISSRCSYTRSRRVMVMGVGPIHS